MKTLKIWGMSLGAILLTIGLAACSNDEFAAYKTEAGVKKISSFTAAISDSAETRAYLSNAGEEGKRSVYWNEKDAISVFSDLEPTFKTFRTKRGSVAGESEGAVPSASSEAVFSGNEVYGTEFYAYYPGDAPNLSQDKEHFTLLHASLPQNDFGLNETIMTPMVAVSNGEIMLFKQVTGLVKISLIDIYRLESVYLYGNNDEVLYGSGTIDLTANEPVFVPDSGQSDNKRLGGRVRDLLLGPNTEEIYFNLPPMTFEKGFTVEVNGYDKDGVRISYKKSTTPNRVIKRGEIFSLARLDVMGDFIHFADQSVENLCLQYFDTNGDGFLSYAEAAAVTEIPTVEGIAGIQYPIFAGKEVIGDKSINILSFNELYYFASLQEIPDYMFFDQPTMAEVKLPDNVKSIGDNAFGRCQSLSTIQIPKGVTFIDKYAFQITKITEALISSGVKTISMGLFSGCMNLENVSIPNSVESIDAFAFRGTGLTSIVIPEGVKTIGLMAITLSSSLKDVLLPSTLTEIGYAAFNENPQMESVTCLAVNPPSLGANGLGNGTTLTIYVPDGSVDAYKTAAGWSAYADRIKSISGGEAITFEDSNVAALCVEYFDMNGDGKVSYKEAAAVTEIPTVEGIAGIQYPIFAGKAVIGDNAINISSFNELRYFSSLQEIPAYMFYNQPTMAEVKLPDNVKSIGDNAFGDCQSLSIVQIPNGVTFIDKYAFQDTKITEAVIPSGVTTISMGLFSACRNLEKVSIPNSVESIDLFAFQGSGITSIAIPEGVKTIGLMAVSGCRFLKDVLLPSTLTEIGSAAFDSNSQMESVTCLAVIPPSLGVKGLGTGTTLNIYVPDGSVNAYKTAAGWNAYADRIIGIK